MPRIYFVFSLTIASLGSIILFYVLSPIFLCLDLLCQLININLFPREREREREMRRGAYQRGWAREGGGEAI